MSRIVLVWLLHQADHSVSLLTRLIHNLRVHAADFGNLAVFELLLRLLVLVHKLKVELSYFSFCHAKDTASAICNASKLAKFEISSSYSIFHDSILIVSLAWLASSNTNLVHTLRQLGTLLLLTLVGTAA